VKNEERRVNSEASRYLDLGMRALKALPIIGMSCKKRASRGRVNSEKRKEKREK